MGAMTTRLGAVLLCLMLTVYDASSSTTTTTQATTTVTTASPSTTQSTTTSTSTTEPTSATTTLAPTTSPDTSTQANMATTTSATKEGDGGNGEATETPPATSAQPSSTTVQTSGGTSPKDETSSPSPDTASTTAEPADANSTASTPAPSGASPTASSSNTTADAGSTSAVSTPSEEASGTTSTSTPASVTDDGSSTSVSSDAASSTATAPTETTSVSTTVTTTPTTPSPVYPTKKPDAPFRLSFKIGDSNESAVYCVKMDSCTFSAILGHVQGAFKGVPGYLYVSPGADQSSRRRKRDTQLSIDVLFEASVLSDLPEQNRSQQFYDSFQNLGASPSLAVNMDLVNATIVVPFVKQTADVCSIPDACGPGYECKNNGICYHLCKHHSCSDHGVCNAIVNADGSSSVTCVCDSDDDHTYSGEFCQNEATSKAKVVAIVGGVLGTICALFLIIIIFLCIRLKSAEGGSGTSRGKYQLGGYSNNGYTEHEFAMKNVTPENP